MKEPIQRKGLLIRFSHLLEDEEPAHVVDFEYVSVLDVFFVSNLLRNGDPALYTYSDI